MMFEQVGKPLLIFALLALAACGSNDKEPKGAILAVVNGEEVTLAELNHEAAARNIRDPSDPKVKKALVQDIVSRKLLAQHAAELEVDRSQAYLLASKRADELLRAEMVVKLLVGSNEQPNDDAITSYAQGKGARNKHIIFIVDQLVFPRPEDSKIMGEIEATNTLEEVQQVLAKYSLPMRRGTVPWDNSRVPPDLMERLQALSAGEVFVLPTDKMVVAGVIRSQSHSEIPDDQQRAMAAATLQQQKAQRLVRGWLESTRRSANIRFQPGYEPAPAAKNQPAS